jgi:O-antigen/teichoic acid export membrane protein
VHVKNALAFIFVDLGMYILEMSVRYILTFYGAELSLGLFSFAYNWVSIIFKFGMLVIYALQPYLSHTYYLSSLNGNYTAKLYQLEKLMIKYSMYILFFGATYFIIFFYDLVILIGKNDYLQTRISIVFLAPLTIFMCISYFLQIIILLAGRSNRIPICYFSIAGLNIVLNFIFVPIFDYKASALINSFSYLILMLMFIIIVPKDAVKLKYSIKEYMSFIVEYFIFVVVMLGINRILQVSPLIKFVISFFILLLFIFLILLRNKIDFYSLNELVKDEGK